jgi:thiol-disulfide isomerase/thioredoxin
MLVGLGLMAVAAGAPATCVAGSSESPQPAEATSPQAATFGYALFETERGPQLLGEVPREVILQHYPEWQEEYDAYEPDSSATAELAAVARPVRVLCVLGTWCSDSAREVPRFWKLLDRMDNERISFRMLAVSRASEADQVAVVMADLGFPQDIRAAFGVEYVPTFIFWAGDVELGRIIETPAESLEADSAAIASNAPAGDEPAAAADPDPQD